MTTIDPALAQQQAQQVQSAPKPPPMGLTVQHVAQALSLGLDATPTDAQGWNRLIAKYEADPNADRFGMVDPLQLTASPLVATATPVPKGTAGGAPATGDPSLDAFMTAVKQHESGGNYNARNADSGAFGAYQIMPANWSSWATQAGLSPNAPQTPQNQDAVAAHQMQQLYDSLGHNWGAVAVAWYAGPNAAQQWLQNPEAPQFNSPQGKYPSINGYVAQVQKALGVGAPSTTTVALPKGAPGVAISQAQSLVGTPYQWGGESKAGFDCSGLVQYVYGQAGLELPRTAQQQYDATTKVPLNQPLQPGDLVFFGRSTTNISHVGIYIGGGMMIDAPHAGANVRIEPYKWADLVGASRPSDPTGISTAPSSLQQEVLGTYYKSLALVQRQMQQAGVAQ